MAEHYGIKNTEEENKKDNRIKKEYAHTGHRMRMREKYKKNGIASFEFHEILELILFSALPRANTNLIAHELEKKFGKSLRNIVEADINALTEIKGISATTAISFKLIGDLTRIYNMEIASKPTSMIDKRVQENYIIARYTGICSETVGLISLNNRMERLADDDIYAGSVNSSKVDLHKMVKIAMNNNAAGVIIAHNHPDGTANPSNEDIETTRRIKRIFEDISINFIDHYVVSGKEISSINDILIHDYLK